MSANDYEVLEVIGPLCVVSAIFLLDGRFRTGFGTNNYTGQGSFGQIRKVRRKADGLVCLML